MQTRWVQLIIESEKSNADETIFAKQREREKEEKIVQLNFRWVKVQNSREKKKVHDMSLILKAS